MSLEVDIRKSFGSYLLDVAFSAGDETLGFLGASGCGKSLTLRCIAGIEKPDEGRIVVNGQVFFDSEQRINLTPQQRKTALLFQNYMLFPNLTVEQNVAAGIGKKVAAAQRLAIVAEELQRFGLSGMEKRYPAQLSGGQQQRVALARMLAARPGILMLDEPFSALDSHLKGVLEQNLASLFDAYKGTILYVSHDIDEALRFCDRIAVVEAGRILEIDSGDELVNNPQSEAALKLSGCKNVTPAQKRGAHEVFLPRWGVVLVTQQPVPDAVKYMGVRAQYLAHGEEGQQNSFRMRVDRTSDARFERMCLMGFVGNDAACAPGNEMEFLHSHVFWRLPKTVGEAPSHLPQRGDELWVRIPADRLFLVTR